MASYQGRRRRLVALFGAAAIAVAACGGGGGGTAAPGATTGGGTSAAPATSEPGGSPSAGGSPGAGTGFTCENIGGEVTVYATWTGAEQDNFDAMMAPWLECTGVTMNYTGQRDLAGALTAAIAGGNLPDVAGLPGPGLMQQWYADGHPQAARLRRPRRLRGSDPTGLRGPRQAVDGKLAASSPRPPSRA